MHAYTSTYLFKYKGVICKLGWDTVTVTTSQEMAAHAGEAQSRDKDRGACLSWHAGLGSPWVDTRGGPAPATVHVVLPLCVSCRRNTFSHCSWYIASSVLGNLSNKNPIKWSGRFPPYSWRKKTIKVHFGGAKTCHILPSAGLALWIEPLPADRRVPV